MNGKVFWVKYCKVLGSLQTIVNYLFQFQMMFTKSDGVITRGDMG